jgi:two-component system, OmpR family, response regulator
MSAATGKILVIEDDAATAFEILSSLTTNGFEAQHAADGRFGLDAALESHFDAITLDRLLPQLDGLEVVGRLRSAGVDTPILMISALSDVDDRITGLRAGGDDYMIKPFAPSEMIARLEVLLRRKRATMAPQLVLRCGELELDMVSRLAKRNGREIELLPMEFRLLEFMMRNAGQTLSRRIIFERVWEYYFDPGTNLIEVHIGRLRKKIDGAGEKPIIRTVRGEGYAVAPPT